MQKFREIILNLFNDGMKIETEDWGTSQQPGFYRSGTVMEYSTVWRFTIHYAGREDVFEYTLPGKADPRPSAFTIFQIIFDDSTYPYEEDFGEWAEDFGYDHAIIEKKTTIKEVWETWQESQARKQRLIRLFSEETFENLLNCDRSDEEDDEEEDA